MKERKYDIVFSLVLAAVTASLGFIIGLYAAAEWGIAKNPKTVIEYVPVTEKSTATSVLLQIDLNTATINDLMTIDGIGEKTAEKILTYREELGGYQFLEQLLDVSGVGEKMLENWRPYLIVNGEAVSSTSDSTTTTSATTTTSLSELKVNLNTATVEDLMKIPGIGETTANKIVAYRKQIGRFVNLEQLLDIDGVGEKKLASWSAYLVLDD